ncbi:hypothetical protein FQN50_001419 [Emmonsiellopsis sp. PD_5]|nr:hypothetical protein FQN50_001419 [Emmonsiellopsis sp. PD_5]
MEGKTMPARTILITGGTHGLGYHCALSLARSHPTYTILLASRTDPNSAAATINTTLSQTNTHYLPLDLSSPANIRSFIHTFSTSSKKYPPLAALLLNAGMQYPSGTRYTPSSGIETTFATNHLGHALLFSLLQPFLADDARIVITASGTHDPAQRTGMPTARFVSAEQLARPPAAAKGGPTGTNHYTNSKLANVLWGYALERRLEKMREADGGKRWTVVSFDPGAMPGTGLVREAGVVFRWLVAVVFPRIVPLLQVLVSKNIRRVEESGETLAWLAVGEGVEGEKGGYFEARKRIRSSVQSYEVGCQEELWGWTVKEIAMGGEERRLFEVVG